ncbi:Serine/threonine-protein kinase RIO2 [Astathelohania contejeani]|uniref:non-specific serine/threonine protein kinase n=1 Tax=Astathelohania contejeani TaxID=164912 RepID=A0ABQ7I1K3_9MICR|nr:Serine/threonine-protein kinase RIO2 [Thelohania contejeani]
MKLLSDAVWTISKEHLKILKKIESLLKTHELVPLDKLKKSICGFAINEYLKDLVKNKFLHYENTIYTGYKLTISGNDCLAITGLRKQGLEVMGSNIGIGKESDIYFGVFQGNTVVIKLHRLGRTSFRDVKNKRDYYKVKNNSWIEMSKTSARREYEFLNLFKGLNVPKVYAYNRHAVVMEYLENYIPLHKCLEFDKEAVYNNMVNFVKKLRDLGYVHGDFNEFNVMVNCDGEIVVIDFPQCMKLGNDQAEEYLKRDFECIENYFKQKFNYCGAKD